MKPLSFLLLITIIISIMAFQTETDIQKEINGAWQLKNGNEEHHLLFADGYFTHTSFDKRGKKFLQTRGGPFTFIDETLTIVYEFDTGDKEQVGKTIRYKAELKENEMETNITGTKGEWKRTDDGTKALHGLWKITARKQDGQLQPIHQSGTRKTIKILTSSRFQWAAIDPGTKSFMGTGGGSYSFENGKYTEHIEFFSRDSTRVGQSLSFDGKLENGDWHHSGLSSKGDPIYEVWSRGE